MAFLRGRCCKSRKGKSRGDEGVENVGKARSGSTDFELPQSAGGDCTEVDIDDTQDLERDEEQGSTVARVFKNIFHASADSKIALKFYGNKKGVLMERKRQDDECCSRWMIHPCSRFRWACGQAWVELESIKGRGICISSFYVPRLNSKVISRS